MALPTTVVSQAGAEGHHPPVKSSGGDFYCIVIDASDASIVNAFKATDPSDSWTEQDAGSAPNAPADIQGYTTAVHDNIIHVASWDVDFRHEHYQFDMDTDSWIVDEFLTNPTDDPNHSWGSLAVRSDGDVIYGYVGDSDVITTNWERTDYGRRESGSWTTGQGVNTGGSTHYGNINVVRGPGTDDMHFVYQLTSAAGDPPTAWTTMHTRTLDPSNTLASANSSSMDTAGTIKGDPQSGVL